MRQLLACLILILSLGSPISLPASDYSSVVIAKNATLTTKIDRRIQHLGLPIESAVTDRHLQRKLRDYLNGHKSTEQMLGRAKRYFPTFEHYLCKYDLPEDLKYLAVVESMLLARAQSPASAAGLWQLMPGTARSLGLRVDGTVDERLDLHASTDAAARMLRELYDNFQDWHLVVAAYNCGPTRVQRAIRSAGGSVEYDRVKPFLPRETRDYVSGYVAAAYTLNYYANHGLTAQAASSRTFTTVNIFRRTSLRQLSRLADLNYKQLRQLNPSLVMGIVPASRVGYAVNVPAESKDSLQLALWGKPNLVVTHVQQDLDEQLALSRVQGFEASEWMLGCRKVQFLAPNYAYTLITGEMSAGWLEQQELVAML